MVKQQAGAAVPQQRRHAGQLVLLDLDLRPHAELTQTLKQRAGVAVAGQPEQCHVERHADNAGRLQILQLAPAGVVAHHGDALVAPCAAGNRVKQAAVVRAIT